MKLVRVSPAPCLNIAKLIGEEVLPELAQSLGADQIGYLSKDKQTGKFADEWAKAYVPSHEKTFG